MVRSLLVLTVLSLYCFVGFSCEEANKTGGEAAVKSGYETRYDNIDLDELLKNDRLRKNYVKCLLNEGPCTPDGQELKNSLPDGIATNCSKCTEKQKNGSLKVTHYIIDNHPDEWEELAVVYDKDGEYKRKYLESKENSENNDDAENDKDTIDEKSGESKDD